MGKTMILFETYKLGRNNYSLLKTGVEPLRL